MRKQIHFLLIAAMTLLIASAGWRHAGAQTKPDGGLLLENHPLVDRIWDTRNAKWITPAALGSAIKNASFILLGETHDNVAHHQLQSRLLDSLINANKKPALLMEQFDVEHQAAINHARSRNSSAEEIADAGQMAKKRWGWLQYKPLVETSIKHALPIIAANLSRADARKVFTDGFKSLPAPFDEKLFTATWNDKRNQAMRAIMIDSHCGQLASSMEIGMIASQRARDAVMANALAAHVDRGVVLIAGRGHVRRDLGVPLYLPLLLSKRGPEENTIVVAFVEVEEGKNKPADYAELRSAVSESDHEPSFDYVWFSARQNREDPCKGMTLQPLAPTKPTATPAQIMQ